MNADGQKRAGGAFIDDQKKCRKVMSRNSVRLSCTRTAKNLNVTIRGSGFNEATFLSVRANIAKLTSFATHQVGLK
jgi:hypothetical protein